MPDTERLERLVESEVGDCCEGDVAERIETVQRHRAEITAREADLAALATLGDDTRYTVAALLVAAGERCVCEISPVVDVGESAVSHALSDLRDAGLATRRKEGAWRYYRATERAEALLEALEATRGDGA